VSGPGSAGRSQIQRRRASPSATVD
jgi:hypothetical protein